jgi:hypothetical protein
VTHTPSGVAATLDWPKPGPNEILWTFEVPGSILAIVRSAGAMRPAT